MDLEDALFQIAARIPRQIEHLKTEEATKAALVMPFINALGYNVFDPTEVIPEFIADVGIKKGEKVDYVIVHEGKVAILIECKQVGAKLSLENSSQLFRYFAVTEARFAILTNGIDFQIFTDIEAPNKMDSKPFFEFNMQALDSRVVSEIKKFAKTQFDVEAILSNASELKYLKLLRAQLENEIESPSEELVRLFTTRTYSGRFTEAVKEQFTKLVQTALRDFIRDKVNARLQSAIEGGASVKVVDDEAPAPIQADDDDGIETTAEEIEGFHIVRAILAKSIDPSRVVMRDTKSYCGILLDDNNRKPICRLRFNFSQKYLGLFDSSKIEERITIGSLNDIYKFEGRLIEAISFYESLSRKESERTE